MPGDNGSGDSVMTEQDSNVEEQVQQPPQPPEPEMVDQGQGDPQVSQEQKEPFADDSAQQLDMPAGDSSGDSVMNEPVEEDQTPQPAAQDEEPESKPAEVEPQPEPEMADQPEVSQEKESDVTNDDNITQPTMQTAESNGDSEMKEEGEEGAKVQEGKQEPETESEKGVDPTEQESTENEKENENEKSNTDATAADDNKSTDALKSAAESNGDSVMKDPPPQSDNNKKVESDSDDDLEVLEVIIRPEDDIWKVEELPFNFTFITKKSDKHGRFRKNKYANANDRNAILEWTNFTNFVRRSNKAFMQGETPDHDKITLKDVKSYFKANYHHRKFPKLKKMLRKKQWLQSWYKRKTGKSFDEKFPNMEHYIARFFPKKDIARVKAQAHHENREIREREREREREHHHHHHHPGNGQDHPRREARSLDPDEVRDPIFYWQEFLVFMPNKDPKEFTAKEVMKFFAHLRLQKKMPHITMMNGYCAAIDKLCRENLGQSLKERYPQLPEFISYLKKKR